jgi:DNA polymerase-3 subunit alpha
MPYAEEFSSEDMLRMEKETTGLYITSHPMAKYSEAAKLYNYARISDILSGAEDDQSVYMDSANVKVLGLIQKIVKKNTKNGAVMLFVTLEDASGSIEMTVFPKTAIEFKDIVLSGKIIIAEGRISQKEDEEPKLICSKIQEFNEEMFCDPKGKLYVRLPSENSGQTHTVKDILLKSKGSTDVYLYYEDTAKYENLKIPQGKIKYFSDDTENIKKTVSASNIARRSK